MRECPGIYFTSEPTGRTAKVAGTGLAVWEVLRDYVEDQDLERLHRAFSHLSRSQITAAMMYYRRHSEEVRREVEANAALTPEMISERHPGLVHVLPLG